MASWYHPDFADGSADMLRARAATTGRIRLRILGSYTLGASYATVAAASIGIVSLVPGDITSAGAAGSTRQHTVAGKAVPLTGADDGAGMHWAITDETDSKVLVAGSGTPSMTPIAAGGTMTSPSFVLASHQQPA